MMLAIILTYLNFILVKVFYLVVILQAGLVGVGEDAIKHGLEEIGNPILKILLGVLIVFLAIQQISIALMRRRHNTIFNKKDFKIDKLTETLITGNSKTIEIIGNFEHVLKHVLEIATFSGKSSEETKIIVDKALISVSNHFEVISNMIAECKKLRQDEKNEG